MYGRFCGMNTCKITQKNLKYCDIMLPWQHLTQREPAFSHREEIYWEETDTR
jgi:hypothetical protein